MMDVEMATKAPKKLSTKKLDTAIGKFYGTHAAGRTINMMDIGKVFAHARTAYAANPTEATLEAAVKEAVATYTVPA